MGWEEVPYVREKSTAEFQWVLEAIKQVFNRFLLGISDWDGVEVDVPVPANGNGGIHVIHNDRFCRL